MNPQWKQSFTNHKTKYVYEKKLKMDVEREKILLEKT